MSKIPKYNCVCGSSVEHVLYALDASYCQCDILAVTHESEAGVYVVIEQMTSWSTAEWIHVRVSVSSAPLFLSLSPFQPPTIQLFVLPYCVTFV